MTPLRPIGHIAANINILALAIVYRLRIASDGQKYVCWVDDDGCVYLALTSHPRANGMLRHAQEQHVTTYLKPRMAAFPLTAADVAGDLEQARVEQATRHMQQARIDAVMAHA